ncbi:MAG: VWA domain-containing protein [Planctomycetes bacterium]|nr:VWA domain-containing protein [Planctomycetota bacterium]
MSPRLASFALAAAGCMALGGAALGDDDSPTFRRCANTIEAALKRGDLFEAAKWVKETATLNTPQAVKYVLAMGELYPGDPIRTAVIEGLPLAKSPEVLEFYAKELSSPKNHKQSILIIEALAEIEDGATIPPLLGLLQNCKDVPLLVASLQALRNKPDKRTLEAMIAFYKRVEDTKEKLWIETRITLLNLTGETFVLSQDWENWWLTAKDSWTPESVPGAKAIHKGATGVHRPKRKLDLPQLFGQEVASKNIVFVVDTSSSMSREDPLEDAPESGAGKERVRLTRAKNELIKVMEELRHDVKFNIVQYHTTVEVWHKDTVVAANPANKRRALEFIKSWKPEGETNTEEAMLAALAIEGVDTIILLSDGSPTIPRTVAKDMDEIGKPAAIPPILEKIRTENRFRKVTVHTLGFKGSKETFMKSLASQNGGNYAPIR